jgi:hypothetical protein
MVVTTLYQPSGVLVSEITTLLRLGDCGDAKS